MGHHRAPCDKETGRQEDSDPVLPFSLSPGLRRLCDLGALCVLLLLLLPYLVHTQPYADFSEQGSGFHGPASTVLDQLPDTVSIGVIAPHTLHGKQMRQAIELAVREANAAGGYQGVPYKVIFRADDGPWGTASKKVVELIYEECVWSIIGFLDGQHAHLAELIAAKAWVPVVTPWASDRSIDYANVPWMFRIMPDDTRQAQLLLGYAKEQGLKKLVVLSEGERESRIGVDRVRQAARHLRHPVAQWFEFSSYQPADVLTRVKGVEYDSLLVWGRIGTLQNLLPHLVEANPTCPILFPSEAILLPSAQLKATKGNLVVAAPYEPGGRSQALGNFHATFAEHTGIEPSPLAVLSYDAARMVLQAIATAGLDRVQIREALSRFEFAGLTRTHRFDSLGGDPAKPVLLRLHAGEWVQIGGNTTDR